MIIIKLTANAMQWIVFKLKLLTRSARIKKKIKNKISIKIKRKKKSNHKVVTLWKKSLYLLSNSMTRPSVLFCLMAGLYLEVGLLCVGLKVSKISSGLLLSRLKWQLIRLLTFCEEFVDVSSRPVDAVVIVGFNLQYILVQCTKNFSPLVP